MERQAGTPSREDVAAPLARGAAEVAAQWQSDLHVGLNAAEVAARQTRYGPKAREPLTEHDRPRIAAANVEMAADSPLPPLRCRYVSWKKIATQANWAEA